MASWKLKNLFWISSDEDSGEGGAASEPPRASVVPSPPANGGHTVESLLSMVRDIDGVIGSILARADGALIGFDLPRTFDSLAAEGAARQMSLLRTALATEAGGMNAGILRFRDFHFHVDEVPAGLIGILAAERADKPALRMAVKVLGRRIEAVLPGGGLAATNVTAMR